MVAHRICEQLIGSYEMQNDFNGRNSRWGISDTYGNARRIPRPGRNNGRDRRNYSHRTFQRNNLSNRRVLIAMSVQRRAANRIMGDITMEIGIIPIVAGNIRKSM